MRRSCLSSTANANAGPPVLALHARASPWGLPRLSHRMARGSNNLADESKPAVGVANI